MRFALLSWFAFVIFVSVTAGAADFQTPRRLQLGRFHSRAIWTPLLPGKGGKAPVVILIPGSGAHGPRELIPGVMPGTGKLLTLTGRDEPVFDQLAQALNRGGVQTLQLGKPGVEDLEIHDQGRIHYDQKLFTELHWRDLVSNVKDAMEFVLSQPSVDRGRIYLLGHSEGTQVAADVAKSEPALAGLILLGYVGSSLSTLVDWQLFRRPIEHFYATDVDADHDGYVTRAEAAKWPEFAWSWRPGQERVSLAEMELVLRGDPQLQAGMQALRTSPLYSDGIFERPPIHDLLAVLPQVLHVYNGALDEQTPPREALRLKQSCEKVAKPGCHVTIVPGVGHGFSAPRPERGHPLLDMTIGPVDPAFSEVMTGLARGL